MFIAPTTLLGLSVILLFVHILIPIYLTTKELGTDWNMGPRDITPEVKSIIAARAKRASDNYKETYPIFLAIMLMIIFKAVTMSGFNPRFFVIGGVIWLLARIAYLPLYLYGIPYYRTVAWGISILGLFIMLIAAW